MSATATLDRATHTYTDGAGERVALCVSDVLRLSGITQPYPEIPSVLNFVEHARMLGEVVHEWADYVDGGGAIEKACDELEGSQPLPYVLAYARFLAEHSPEWEHIEHSFALDGCAGTPDRIGTILRRGNRIPVIVDLKTPQKAEKHWQIQLSAYQHLSSRIDCLLYVLHLRSDGTFKLLPYQSDILTFLAALQVAKWRINNGAKIK